MDLFPHNKKNAFFFFFSYKSQCQLCFHLAVGWVKIDSEVMMPSEEEPGMAWEEGERSQGWGRGTKSQHDGDRQGFCPRTMVGQGEPLTRVPCGFPGLLLGEAGGSLVDVPEFT